jgi:hypothetical protein
MVFWVTDYRYLTAIFAHDRALGDRFGRVIGTLGMKLGFDETDNLSDSRLIKDRNRVNAAKRRNDLGTFILRDNRPSIAFELANLFVGVYRDEQCAAERFCSEQVSNVPGVN